MSTIKPDIEFYERIKYVMARIHPEEVLPPLGIRLTKRHGKYVTGYCPDHLKFTGRNPSHPKWTLNSETGETYCYTESRKSNIVYVIARSINVSHDEAFNLLRQGVEIPDKVKLAIANLQNQCAKPTREDHDPSKNETLTSMKSVLAEGHKSDRLLEYFGKYGIKPTTVAEFGIVESVSGKYRDRAIIPCYDTSTVIVGFVAVDLLGCKTWVRQAYDRVKGDMREGSSFSLLRSFVKHLHDSYKKALFCPKMPTGQHLFGFEKLLNNGHPDFVVLVEGEKDVLKLQQEGIPAVGAHGAKCTIGQRQLLKEHGIKKVAVAFDGDEAGKRVSAKVVEVLTSEDFITKEIKVADGKDPKDYDRASFSLLLGNLMCQPQGGLLTQLEQRIRRNAR